MPEGQLGRLLEKVRSEPLTKAEIDQMTELALRQGLAREVVGELARAVPNGPLALRQAKRLIARGNAGIPPMRGKVRTPPPEETGELLQVGDLLMTHHAVDRYASRHRPGMPKEDVLEELRREAASAAPVRGLTVLGDEQWKSDSGVLFVVKRGAKARTGRTVSIAVTVLPAEPDGRMERRRKRRKRR